MRKSVFIIMVLLLLQVCLNKLNAQDTIPNAGFESWPIANQNNPEFWDSSNKITMAPFVGYVSVSRTTDAYEGDFAARLVTGSLLGTVLPGVLTLGNLNLNLQDPLQSISGGVPFTARPALLRGYYKYETPADDWGLVLFGLYRFNEELQQRDTIAAGIGLLTQMEEYSLFSMPVFYFADLLPDTMNIIFLSSISEEMVVGSALTIDNLHFVFGEFPEVDLGPDQYICPGQTISVDAGGEEGYSYFWANVETGEILGQERVLVVDAPGHYGVLVLNESGLPGSDHIYVFEASSPVIFQLTGGGEYTPPDQGVEIGLSGSELGVNYTLIRDAEELGQWVGTGHELSFGVQSAGIYTVLAVSQQHGCQAEMEGVAEVIFASSVLNNLLDGRKGVFPNPSKGAFNIKTNWAAMAGTLNIYNADGKMVHEQSFETNWQGITGLISISRLEPGFYIVKLQNSHGELNIFRLISLP